MHKQVGWLSGIFAALALASTGAGAAPEAADDSITARVHERLIQEGQLAPDKIAVSTSNGVVHIEGKVPSTDAAKRAIHLAEATEGVRGVWVNFEAEE